MLKKVKCMEVNEPKILFNYASFGERLLALIIDMIPGAILGFYIPAFGTNIFLGVLYGWLYKALFESSKYQGGLGKIAMGIAVTDDNGQRIDFGTASLRHFSSILSALLFCVGYIMMLFSDQNKCLHDKISGTLVIKRNN